VPRGSFLPSEGAEQWAIYGLTTVVYIVHIVKAYIKP